MKRPLIEVIIGTFSFWILLTLISNNPMEPAITDESEPNVVKINEKLFSWIEKAPSAPVNAYEKQKPRLKIPINKVRVDSIFIRQISRSRSASSWFDPFDKLISSWETPTGLSRREMRFSRNDQPVIRPNISTTLMDYTISYSYHDTCSKELCSYGILF